jgi:hypothetical protein
MNANMLPVLFFTYPQKVHFALFNKQNWFLSKNDKKDFNENETLSVVLLSAFFRYYKPFRIEFFRFIF